MDIRELNLKGAEAVISSIEHNLLLELKDFAASRLKDVERGAETPELAALLVEKYGYGLAKAAHIVGLNVDIHSELNKLLKTINPAFETTRMLRLKARPAALLLTAETPVNQHT